MLDYRLEPITRQSLKSEEYLAKNPFGAIPLMEDTETGAMIYESRVICKCA
jgi:glutathione S-transferase